MCDVVTIGETMVMFSPAQSGPLRYVHNFQKRMAGAESNVAIGLARLGHSCSWISRVGDDEFGRFLLRELQGEGVDISQVKMDPHAPTGIMFKEIREGSDTRVYYYRSGSAASRMTPEDLEPCFPDGAKILHITGITPALGECCRNTVMKAVTMAKEQSCTVSFDPNIRLKLWSREEAAKTLGRLVPYADILLCGQEEGEILFGTDNAQALLDCILNAGVGTAVVKMGTQGCWIASGEERHRVEAFPVSRVVDPIGAGDAFAAGFLAGVLEGGTLLECGRLANAMGAFAVTAAGDFEGLPDRRGMDAFLRGQAGISR